MVLHSELTKLHLLDFLKEHVTNKRNIYIPAGNNVTIIEDFVNQAFFYIVKNTNSFKVDINDYRHNISKWKIKYDKNLNDIFKSMNICRK